ncbi:MAG: hypothetical protein GX640_20460 [Fibrobacter sp.]|nr:hypothetical protein [Fibrobacter sp.]
MNLIRFSHFVIVVIICINYSIFAENGKKEFDFIQVNPKGIKEYRIVLHVNKNKAVETIKKIFEQSLNDISDTIRNRSYGYGKKDDFPKAISNFSIGRYHYKITRLFVFDRYYLSVLAMDEKCENLCIWSFKTSPTGSSIKSATGLTKKISKKLLKTCPWLIMSDSYTMENKNKSGK